MTTTAAQDRVRFTGAKVIQAIIYHLVDDHWFDEVPPGLIKWLKEQLPEQQLYDYKACTWRESRSGTQRMLWLLVSANIDPFELCKWLKNGDAQKMHQRFTSIIDSWHEPCRG